jgi:hypothetical protein
VLYYNYGTVGTHGKVLYTTTKKYSVQFWLVLHSAHLLFFAHVTVVITIEHMVHKANLCVASAPMQALVGTKE